MRSAVSTLSRSGPRLQRMTSPSSSARASALWAGRNPSSSSSLLFRTSFPVRQAPRGKATHAATGSPPPPSALEGDAGKVGTKVHHWLARSMAILAPTYWFFPESKSDSFAHRSLGMLLSANISVHAWIGLNYVATDYVPKVSAALLKPARYATAGLALTIFLGLTKISLASPGGLKAVIKGVWNGKRKDKFDF